MAIPEKAFIDYVVLAGAYNWDPALTNQQHRQELIQFFQPDPKVSKSDIRDILSKCFDHKPDRFLRTGEESPWIIRSRRQLEKPVRMLQKNC